MDDLELPVLTDQQRRNLAWDRAWDRYDDEHPIEQTPLDEKPYQIPARDW